MNVSNKMGFGANPAHKMKALLTVKSPNWSNSRGDCRYGCCKLCLHALFKNVFTLLLFYYLWVSVETERLKGLRVTQMCKSSNAVSLCPLFCNAPIIKTCKQRINHYYCSGLDNLVPVLKCNCFSHALVSEMWVEVTALSCRLGVCTPLPSFDWLPSGTFTTSSVHTWKAEAANHSRSKSRCQWQQIWLKLLERWRRVAKWPADVLLLWAG